MMPRILISASDEGFFNSSPLGAPLAPNVFLKTSVNLHGEIVNSGDGWHTFETEMYSDFGIRIHAETAPSGAARLGKSMEVSITEITYFRIEGGREIATATLKVPMTITATYDQIAPASYGWMANLGDPLQSLVQIQGFKFIGGTGDDILAAHTDILPIYGDNIIRGRGGNDILHGSLGDDAIYGGTGDDILIDLSGRNFLSGQSGNDTLTLGDNSNRSISKGGKGDDTLISGRGSDALRGGAGNDILLGGRGDDTLFGGRGSDILNGGIGSDILKGNFGADRFVFNTEDSGFDQITDFTHGTDLIVLEGLASFDQLNINQQGDDTLVTWGDDSAILLSNVEHTMLDVTDFIFG